jgi:hypothetical protein
MPFAGESLHILVSIYYADPRTQKLSPRPHPSLAELAPGQRRLFAKFAEAESCGVSPKLANQVQ